jgi:hypothetical protein
MAKKRRNHQSLRKRKSRRKYKRDTCYVYKQDKSLKTDKSKSKKACYIYKYIGKEKTKKRNSCYVYKYLKTSCKNI